MTGWIQTLLWNPYKRNERRILKALLCGSIIFLAVSIGFMFIGRSWGRPMLTAGGLLQLAGLIQLDVSGLFELLMQLYSDEEEFPGGPPSRVTREVIWNPDRPRRSDIRAALYFNSRTGF